MALIINKDRLKGKRFSAGAGKALPGLPDSSAWP
jgi:hypothetical protein